MKPNRGLHVPEPAARPGDSADFSGLSIPAAGTLSRPPPDAHEEALRTYPYGLIRVLDDRDQAVGDWDPKLDVDVLIGGLRAMLLTRRYDERMLRAQRQGKASFYLSSTGEEGVAVAQAMALDAGDMLFSAYRQQGLLIARGWDLVDLMCQVLSNAGDRLKGRQMPIMYSVKKAGFFSVSGNLGTQFPQAVGWAMAAAIKRDSRIAAGWVGDGTTAEADFHHGMTFASVYQAPVVLNIVNNQWAISSFHGFAGGERTTFAARAIGYGIPGLRVDGNDFLATFAATRWAAERARAGHGPTLIELFTYRAAAHSTSDDPSAYRPKDEFAQWPLGDPIERLRRHLCNRGAWSDAQHAALVEETEQQVQRAFKQAETFGPLTASVPAESMFEDVYKEMPPHLQRQVEELKRG